jgi:hypothetical protein
MTKEVKLSAGRVIAIIIGSLCVLVGIVLLFGGGALVGINQGLTDEEGFLTLPRAEFERETYAVVAELSLEDDWIWWYRRPTTVRIRMTGEQSMFIGIGSRAALEGYLYGVSYSRIDDMDFQHYRKSGAWRTDYRDYVGLDIPEPPYDQSFWHASIQGSGTQELLWNIEPGDWVIAVMNADGSRGIHVEGSVGAKAPWLLGIGIGLLASGLVFIAIGLVLILLMARRTRRLVSAKAPEATPLKPGAFPLTLKAELTEPLSPAFWLVKWFLLIPHLVVLAFLWVGFVFSWLFSLFAILFTGRYPRRLFDYNVGVMRWMWRVAFYSYQGLGTDQYPPFTLKAGGYPADLDVSYPDKLSPGLALVKWWLLAVPHYIVIGLLQGGGGYNSWGLTTILTLFAGVTLLFTGKYPKDIFRLVVGMNRWTFRVFTYVALMTDVYPPFRLEE